MKFYVKENNIRAVNNTSNGPVWEDSCVEFFISFDDRGYYNLEFNCIGTGLIGFGNGKTNRTLLSANVIDAVKSQSQICRQNKDESISWELTLSIPFSTFVYHDIVSLQGKECKVNFYKCGDLLPEPHFKAWNNIQSAEPNFHLPDFFGKIIFE